MDWDKLAEQKTISKTIKALKANGINAEFVEDGKQVKERLLKLIPKGAEVMTMQSMTLKALGLDSLLDESRDFNAVRPKLMNMNRERQNLEMQKLGAAPDWSIGSVHAVTEDGHVFIASNTGSQLASYVSASSHVVWVVGIQKIVKNDHKALKRIYDHILPLESERINKQYNLTSGSFVSKILIINREIKPDRITLIFVGEKLGF
jgi:L-lactate utilization protein LutB